MGFSLSDAHDKWQEDKNKAQGESDSGNNWLSELRKGEHESDSSDSDGAEASAGKNNGGFGAGLGYLGQKYVGGVVSNIEGMVDLVQGGFADLIGQDEYAKKVFEEDWYDYDAADKKFNPGTGWKVAGDVAGVLGSATPDILIGIGTGAAGLGSRVIGKGISLATSFASGAGRGVSEAVKATGKLGAKEWLGGTGSGVLAAGIEGVSDIAGEFTGNIIGRTSVEFGSEIGEAATKRYSSEAIGSALGKAVSKETASEIGSEAGEGAIKGFIRKLWGSKGVKELLGEAVSEGGEEFFETLLEPYIIQSTYDPSHPEASVNDLLYSAFLGAAGGGLISGGVQGVNAGINSIRGAKLTGNSNSLSNLFSSADAIVDYENNKNTGSAVFSAISEVYNSIKESMGANGGRITLSTMEKIGELEGLVSTAVLQPSVVNAAKGIARNSEKMAEALNNFYKKTGSDRRITAEQLTDGLKLDGTSQQFVNSVTSALKTNGIFREVVINNMLGRLEFDSRAYANAIFGDIPISTIATQQNLNRFLAKSDAATLQQVGEALGVEDWAKLTPEKLAEKLQFFRDSGASKAYEGGVLAMKKAKATTAYTNGMPSSISSLKNGVTRFKAEGLDFAIIRDGKGYRLYDYESGSITKVMSRGEMEALMQRLKEWQSEAGKESELAALDRELDGFALENVPEYKSLTESEREAVRATLRYARANGISLKDQILFARIAAKSGMNIIAVPSLEGNKVAWYDGRSSIYLDASAPRTRSFKALLGHEMWHKMFKAKKIKKPFMQAWNKIDEGKRKSIIDQYMAEEQRQGKSPRESAKVSAEEVAAAYAEEVFNFPHVWEFVLDGEPTLKDKVIAFFKGSPKRYSFAPEMDPAARAWLREYKNLFDEVARLNAGMNVAENVGASDKVIRVLGRLAEDEKTPAATQVPEKVIKRIGKLVGEDIKTPLTNMNQKDMSVSGRSAIKYPQFTPEKITQNIEHLANMASVKNIDASKLNRTGKAPDQIFQEYFDSLGNSLYSSVFGDIALKKSSVKSERRHGFTAEKIASIEAIPDVIEKGKVIFHKHKGDPRSSVERIVVAAPIKIGLNDYYMGVMLQRDSNSQRLYLHNVASIKAEEARTSSRDNSLTNWSGEEDSHLFITSILQNAINVKLNKEKKLGNNLKFSNPDGRSALKTDPEYKAKIDAKAEAKIAKAKARAEAKAETRVEKAKAKAEARADQTIETERTKLAAEYETDRVFSQATVNKALGDIEAFKALPSKVRSELARNVWLEMSESDGAEWRRAVEIEQTVKICDAILNDPGSKYDATNVFDRRRLNDEISKALAEISKSGKASFRSKMEGELRREARSDEEARRHILSGIYQSLKKIDDVKKRRFLAASDYKSNEFKTSIEALTRMDWRGEFNDKIARKQIRKLKEWYNPENPLLKGEENKTSNGEKIPYTLYVPDIAYMLEALSSSEGKFSRDELQMLRDCLGYFTKLIGEYDMVYVGGKRQSGEKLVYKMRDTIEKQEKMKPPIVIRAMRNKWTTGALRAFTDSLSVMKLADMYEDGIFTKIYTDWMQGEISAEGEALMLKEEYDAFMKNKQNRKYLARAEADKVTLHGQELNRLQLIEYAMTLKRRQAWKGIATGGVVFSKTKSNSFGKKIMEDVEFYPITPIAARGIEYDRRLELAIKAESTLVESMLTDQDKEYIAILERGYIAAGRVKAEGDIKRLGFANVIDGYYYPIRRAYTDKMSDFDAELFVTDKYKNASFNKNMTPEAKAAVRIGSADTTFHRHIQGVTRYMYLSPVMDSFNKLYKLRVLKTKPGLGADIAALYKLQGSTFSLQSLIAQSASTWRDDKGNIIGYDYLQNLMLDTMGGGKRNVGDDITGWLRSNYVGFALGANPKVLATQFSSLFASTSILNARAHLRASLVSGRGVDNYSVVAKLRNSDYTVLKSNAVSDRVSELSKWFTQGMSLFDRIVVKRAFAAAQAQVAQRGGPKIGTKENLIAAGKLLDKVILETQQNAISSRKTEAARRGNMLVKTMIMFKSDAITMQGRVIDAWGEWRYLLAKKNAAGTEASGIDKNINRAKKKLARSIGAVLGSSVYMLIVAETFRHLYGKADENETEDEKRKRLWLEMVSNLVGGMPIVSTVIEVFTSGYDLESMEFSAINDILSTSKQIVDLFQEAAQGKATKRDYVRMAEKLLYTAGQTFGLPFRNVKNVVYGITKILNPEAAYKWDSALYDQSYGADFEDAIEKDDLDMAVTILELAFGERMGSGLSDKAIAELMRLAKIGENVLPSAIGDSITIDGEERELTGEELKAVREKYSEAVERINVFVESDLYKDFDNEQKADAVRKIYSLYKNLAYDSVLGTERDKEALILSKIIDADILCANEALSVMRADKDEDGKTISGSKREKIVAAINEMDLSDEEKLMLIATNGFKLKDGDIEGVSKEMADDMLYDYIAGLDLSEEEKNALYEYCGYEIKDGEVTGSAASGNSSSSGSSSGSTSSKRKGSSSLPGGDRLTGGGKLSGANEKKVVKIGKLDTSKIEKRIVRIGKLV